MRQDAASQFRQNRESRFPSNRKRRKLISHRTVGYVMATKAAVFIRSEIVSRQVSATAAASASTARTRSSFRKATPADAVFYIQKGKVKLTVVSEQGKEAVIAILGTDEFFGEGCLAGQAQRIATVTTMTDSVIVRLEKAAIIQVIHQEPAFSGNVHCASSGPEHPRRSGPGRSAVQFEREAACPPAAAVGELRQGRTPEPVIAKISQETLAEMIGTTRSRVSFFMNKFRKLGFIDYNGGIEGILHSSLLNVVLHDQPQIKA